MYFLGFPGGSAVKNLPANQKTWVQSLEKEMATRSSILAWESHGQRCLVGYSVWGGKSVGRDLVTKQQQQHPLRKISNLVTDRKSVV